MSKMQVIGGSPSKLLGLLADQMHKLQHGVITVHELELFLQRKNPFAISDVQSEWQEFYRKYFRLEVNFSDVQIPEDIGGFERIIFIPKGLKLNDVLKAIRRQFPAWSYTDDLDKDVIENFRQSNCNYDIRIRERVEADEELKNLSANTLYEQATNCMTLLERLVLELKYFSETNKHMDVNNVTICAGSRSRGGRVPDVCWQANSGTLRIRWCYPGYADGSLRARQAVS
jgi:hypothetical protein